MNTIGRLTVDIDCSNCGFSEAVRLDTGTISGATLRCADCGRFASKDSDACCVKHEVRESPYPSGACPACEQGRSVRAQEQEMMQRRANPRMHNTVDAPRW